MASPGRGHQTVFALPPDDASLIVRVRSGDYAAFNNLFHTYYGQLLTFALRLTGTPDLAEDIVQDVFVSIWERRTEWHATSGLTAYLCGAVRNRVRQDLRQRATHERLAPHVDAHAPTDPETAAHAAGIDDAVARAITRLAPRCQAVYTLRWYDQLTYPEIAHILGISVKAVEAHVTTALQTLRRSLRRLV